ncbi:hypothetical protein CIHG_01907 [Coccidioides immitis H538.4]|uniref:Uncharacterized protein n=3 Tax=Coccidioides immitis TaxID=5501 RepID=A0A0J8TJ62_COCIT|nr:hypothetical protein CIRG_06232 [Coccidioides immitis RMSCC 2394]KMU73777.1 hypothetical protein CISG_03827 [Coccidioides immitis RMSCC 3703]KMU84121.1 hypothetical protein CIHG_01907 [Coccidioides immitis H538.4]
MTKQSGTKDAQMPRFRQCYYDDDLSSRKQAYPDIAIQNCDLHNLARKWINQWSDELEKGKGPGKVWLPGFFSDTKLDARSEIYSSKSPLIESAGVTMSKRCERLFGKYSDDLSSSRPETKVRIGWASVCNRGTVALHSGGSACN